MIINFFSRAKFPSYFGKVIIVPLAIIFVSLFHSVIAIFGILSLSAVSSNKYDMLEAMVAACFFGLIGITGLLLFSYLRYGYNCYESLCKFNIDYIVFYPYLGWLNTEVCSLLFFASSDRNMSSPFEQFISKCLGKNLEMSLADHSYVQEQGWLNLAVTSMAIHMVYHRIYPRYQVFENNNNIVALESRFNRVV